MNRSRLVTALAVPLIAATSLAGLTTGTTAVAASTSDSASVAEAGSPLKVHTPTVVEGYRSGTRLEFDPGIRLVAGQSTVEIRSKREAYGKPIVTRFHRGDQVVTLPRRTVTDFAGLPGFLRMDFHQSGRLVATRFLRGCLNSWSSERVQPDAPIRSPYHSRARPAGSCWAR